MKRLSSCVLVILFGFASFSAISQPTLSLDEVIQIGLDNNYQIKILRANEQIAKNSNNAANADFLPTIGLNGAYSLTNTNTKQEFFNGESRSANAAGSRNANAALQANWTLFDGFRRQAIREILQLEERRSSEFTRSEILQLMERIEVAYYQIAQMQHQIELTEHSIGLNQAIKTLAEQKQKIGSGSQSEVLQARGQLNTDSILLIGQKGEIARHKLALIQLIQEPLDTTFTVDNDVQLEPLVDAATMIEEASNRNPQLLLARIEQLSTDHQIKEIKSVLYPKLDLHTAYNYNFSRAEVGFLLSNRTFGPTARASVTYDIFSGRNIKKELQNVNLLKQNLIMEQERIEWEISAQISDLYANYHNQLKLRKAEENNIRIVVQNRALASELYRQGRNTNFEVREAILRETQAKDRLIQNTYNLKYIEIQLKAIAGLLIP